MTTRVQSSEIAKWKVSVLAAIIVVTCFSALGSIFWYAFHGPVNTFSERTVMMPNSDEKKMQRAIDTLSAQTRELRRTIQDRDGTIQTQQWVISNTVEPVRYLIDSVQQLRLRMLENIEKNRDVFVAMQRDESKTRLTMYTNLSDRIEDIYNVVTTSPRVETLRVEYHDTFLKTRPFFYFLIPKKNAKAEN